MIDMPMNIALDMDSVIADIGPALVKYHNKRFGTSYTIEDHDTYDFTKVWGCSAEEAMERVFDFYRSEDANQIQPVKGAVGAVSYLSQKHKLYVITSRPHFTDKKTLNWVEKYFPGKFERVIHSNQFNKAGEKFRLKSEIALELRAEAMFEDHIDYANDCAEAGIKTYLLEMPWNRGREVNPLVTRMRNWTEVEKYF